MLKKKLNLVSYTIVARRLTNIVNYYEANHGNSNYATFILPKGPLYSAKTESGKSLKAYYFAVKDEDTYKEILKDTTYFPKGEESYSWVPHVTRWWEARLDYYSPKDESKTYIYRLIHKKSDCNSSSETDETS